nr:hypothetical protein [Tanacetum cinerariifolium]
PVAPTTAEQRLARKNELKAREKRFGRNKETKKVQKTLLRQQYKNFTGLRSESLDQIHDRLQKLISQLEILGDSLSQKDINLKFLRSLLAEWQTHSLIWRNKIDLEEQSLNDLFNNLKIYEAEAVSVVASVSVASAKVFVSALPNVDTLSDAIIYSFFASQSNSPQLDNDDLKAFKQKKNQPTMPSWHSPPQVLPVLIMSPVYNRYQSRDGYRAVPPPYTGTFMPPKPDLVFHDAPTVNETVHTAFHVSESEDDSEGKSMHTQKGNPHHALKDKGLIDSGCSRHMTGNMSYLTNFKEINGGYVAFGGNPKGGKITDTKCIVLSPDFKMPDENKVLLRVPRENNMYNMDLKNIDSFRDLTCLFAKVTLDEYNLCHRRLGHINFKAMNKLIKGNLVRGLPSKVFENNHTCVACKKGKQHRASYSLLHISFWAEAVNTACYVQNRVLVTKPHNKTPYEVLLGRTPSKDFMRPFSCHVTILNTLDPLGKFDGKIDEGFLVGYSPASACNQPYSSAGIQEHFDAEKAKERNVKQYVLFPLWSQNTDDDAPFKVKKPEFAVKNHFMFLQAIVLRQRSIMTRQPERLKARVIYPIPAIGQVLTNSTNTFSAAGPSNTAVTLEDITYSDDEEDVVAEADFSNLETNINFSPIPTTRVHKDHLVTQIIGDLTTAPQTRSMTRMVKEQEPKRVHQALKDPIWIEAMQEELLQFKMQKVYVDDIIFCSTNKDLCKAFEKLIKDKFQMSSMGELTFFLGLQVKQKQDGIFISHDKYVAEILRKFGLTYVKSASAPIDTEKPLHKDPNGEDVDAHTYISMIGSLIYLTSSRPDIMFAIAIRVLLCRPMREDEFATWERGNSTWGGRLGALGTVPVYAQERARARDGFLAGKDLPSTTQVVPTPHPSPPQQQQPSQPTTVSMDLLQTLLETYTAQTRRVENLEQDKIDQALEIIKLKKRVRKLEKKRKLRDDASKQGGIIAEINADEDVILEEVDVAKDAKVAKDAAVLSIQDDEPEPAKLQEVIEVVTTAKLMTEVVTAATTTITTATIPAALSVARRRKWVVIRDPEETATPSTIVHTEPKSKDKGKWIMVQKPKPLKKKAQIEQDETYARELEAKLNKNIN